MDILLDRSGDLLVTKAGDILREIRLVRTRIQTTSRALSGRRFLK